MRVILLCVFLAFPSPPSTGADAKLVAAKLESRYRAAHTLQATFLQIYSDNERIVRTEAGTAYFRRPGKMRWEYESPEKNLFLVDGKTAWFYVPQDHTVTRAPAKQSSDWRTPLALLAGEMKLSRICVRVELTTAEKPAAPDNVVLHCPLRGEQNTPSSASNKSSPNHDDGPDQSVFLEIVPTTGDLARVVVREKGGIGVEYKFANWQFDPPVAESLFHFEAPRGVAIVNGESPDPARP